MMMWLPNPLKLLDISLPWASLGFILVCVLENIFMSTQQRGLKCPQNYEGHRFVKADFASHLLFPSTYYLWTEWITCIVFTPSGLSLCRSLLNKEERDIPGSLGESGHWSVPAGYCLRTTDPYNFWKVIHFTPYCECCLELCNRPSVPECDFSDVFFTE